MRIAICEDVAADAQLIYQLLREVLQERKKARPVIDHYTDGASLLEHIVKKGKIYDLIFLDIFMPGENGMKIGEKIADIREHTSLVFVSTSKEYAVDAFELYALHYIIKPITKEKLSQVIDRYENLAVFPVIMLKQGVKNVTVHLEQICYLQSMNKKTEIMTKNGEEILVTDSLLELEERLDDRFLKIIRGFIVNMDYITQLKDKYCILEDGQKIPVSRREKLKIREKYNEYLYSKLNGMP